MNAPDPPSLPDPADAADVAVAIARNLGYAVFPCRANKAPAIPKRDGGSGFRDASNDPARIRDMWTRWPGPLVGVATGAISGISVLDIDIDHDSARAWWTRNQHKLPITRTYRTRRGGIHLFFQHDSQVRCATGKPVDGIDVRSDGGYVISWFAAGFPCLDHHPAAPWPAWLTTAIWPPPPVVISRRYQPRSRASAVDGLLRVVREAREGSRNTKLNWAAYHMREHVGAGVVALSHAHADLLAAALAAGLSSVEAERTLTSALGAAR